MSTPLNDQLLTGLAPQGLPTYRTGRYGGEGISVLLADFAHADRSALQKVYVVLLALRDLLDPRGGGGTLQAARALLQEHGWGVILEEMRQLGSSEGEDGERPQYMRAVLHDLRGGAFQALAIHLQLLDLGLAQEEDLTRVFLLTRDHLKIMRNCIPDLDAQRYDQDRRDRAHSVRLLIEKWDQNIYQVPGVSASVVMDCRFEGSVSERCIEFSALDRVIYNLMNNAVRNTADEVVYLVLLPLPAETPKDLRFVVYNRVTSEQRTTLEKRYGDRLSELFRGGFTTGGSGQGMNICANFVMNAYGLQTIDQALDGGYIGAAYQEGYFVNWVHWPVVPD
ncbi:MAG TPA: ATP-binding protein [Roseiflexaceae bacterium]|nr:ATP-binding protein [Roseiflexaceae bacterium]